MIKQGDKRVISYREHVIWMDKERFFKVALKKDGTDDYFKTMDDAMNAIDEVEDNK